MCGWQLVGLGSTLWWSSGIRSYGLKGNDWFLQCKRHYIRYIAVGRLSSWTAVSMCSYGVSDISAGVGEGVGRKVNGTGLTSGSIARSGVYGDGSSVGAETCIDSELVEVGEFLEGDRGELVRRSWLMDPRRGYGNLPRGSI